MAGPGPIDSSSPFFASVAGQAALSGGAVRGGGKKEKGKAADFGRLVKEKAVESAESSLTESITPKYRGMSGEKILEHMLDDVHSAGDLLKEKPLPDNIVAYKAAVRSFVKFVVDRAYDVSERTSGGNILKRKKFTQVQVIDQKLEQLAAGILSGQKSQLALLERIEEINGLLVDLMS